MSSVRFFLLLIVAVMAGCATGSNRVVQPGVQGMGQLLITASPGWYSVPRSETPGLRSNGRTWTKDDATQNRLIIIPTIEDGKTLFDSSDVSAPLEPFRVDMGGEEISELITSSLAVLYPAGTATITSSNLRPEQFGINGGHMLDIDVMVSGGPGQKGMAGAFVFEEKLYTSVFLATPEQFDTHGPDATAVILSMQSREKTIGRF